MKTRIIRTGLCITLILITESGLLSQSPGSVSSTPDHLFRLPLPLTDALRIPPAPEDTLCWYLQAWLKQRDREDVLVGIAIDQDSASSHRWHALIPSRSMQRLYSEAVVLTEIAFAQEAVENGLQDNYFGLALDKKSIANIPLHQAKNVRTEVIVLLQYLDTSTGASLGSSHVRGVSRRGSLRKSKREAEERLYEQLDLELQRIYGLCADLTATQGNTIRIPMGQSVGIYPNMNFSLISPERPRDRQQGREWQPAGTSGFARVTAAGDSTSVMQIRRQWRELPAGSFILPYTQPIFSIYLHLQPPLFGSYSQYGLFIAGTPLTDWDWGFGVNVIQVKDSFDDHDLGFGMGFFTRYRLGGSRRVDCGIKLGGDLDIPFRKDLEGASVNTLLLSAQAAWTAEMVISYRVNMVMSTGYRISTKASSWSYSDEDETYGARWHAEAPEVSNSGFYFSLGFRYCLF